MKTKINNRIFQISAVLLLIAALPAVSAPGAEKPDSLKMPEDFHVTKYRFWRAALEMEGFNIVMTMFGRYIMEPDGLPESTDVCAKCQVGMPCSIKSPLPID